MGLKSVRKSGIELLRIYAILCVIILHYFNGAIGGATNYLRDPASDFVASSARSLAICAVDLFVIISAYFLSSNSRRSLSKIIFLLLEASIVRIILYFVSARMDSSTIKVSGFVHAAIMYGYFIVFYSIVYLLSPLVNLALDKLDRKGCRNTVAVMFFLFSVLPTIASTLGFFGVFFTDWNDINTVTVKGSFEGYTIVNFFLCYMLGYYIRHWIPAAQKKTPLVLLFAGTATLLLLWRYAEGEAVFTYDNPLVILESVFLLLIFREFQFQSSVINELASSGFTCYLVHTVFFQFIGIETYASKSWYVLLAHFLFSAIGIYLICYVIHKLYSIGLGWLEALLSPKIDRLSSKLFPNLENTKK